MTVTLQSVSTVQTGVTQEGMTQLEKAEQYIRSMWKSRGQQTTLTISDLLKEPPQGVSDFDIRRAAWHLAVMKEAEFTDGWNFRLLNGR